GICVAVLLAADAVGIFVPRFTRDPGASDGRFGTGAVSLMGTIAWSVAATSLVFAGLLRRAEGTADRATVRLLLGSGAFTAFLCLDDTFAVHENADRVGDAAELAVGVLFLALGLCWLAWSRPLADHQHRPALIVACLLLATSLGIDTVSDAGIADVAGGKTDLVEDVLKVAGVAAWMVWAVSTAWAAVQPRPARPGPATTPAPRRTEDPVA